MPKGFYDIPACEIRAGCLTDWERDEMQFELHEFLAQEQADRIIEQKKGQQNERTRQVQEERN
jgi:hypothetical protein